MSGIGVLGGTFDPVHIGHLVTALEVRHALALERVLLVTAGDPWQKHGAVVASAVDRAAMVAAAVEGVAGLEACDVEVERAGPSYTADTLAELQRRHPGVELHLIVGSDAAAGLDTWERPHEVAALATVVVVRRPGAEASVPPPGWRYQVVDVPRLDVSSTDLRARIATGRPVRYLLPDTVAALVAARGLYGAGTGARAGTGAPSAPGTPPGTVTS